MAKTISVVVNYEDDELIIQCLAAALRANQGYARQLRDFADTIETAQEVQGLQFQPKPGQILACHFGLGFKIPEMTKTRPVLVVSPHQAQWTGLCTVVPISSKRPEPIRPYHYQLPAGVIPNDKYEEAWIKGDLAVSIGRHRLDRLKVGFRKYVAPKVDDSVLREARRCILHATGMHSLTVHW